MGRTDGEIACAKMPRPATAAPAPAMANAFRNFLREAPESNSLPVALRKFANVS
jgi:hypothetical protein